MKLGSLKRGGRDGTLVVVNRELTRMVLANGVAPSFQAAIDNWVKVLPELRELYNKLNDKTSINSRPFVASEMSSPLPRAFQWADGSAYLNHMRLVRKARGAEMPAGFDQEPLLYQGGSDGFIGPEDPIEVFDEAWGIDFESEVAIITNDVPYGVTYEQAADHIQLIMLCNDVSLRNIMRPELTKGFGFFQSKPASAFSPVCVTPDELGHHWDGRKISLPLLTELNGELFGRPNAGDDLTFDFCHLIQHAAMTRSLGAGTIIGSGTVSNKNPEVGSSCIQEKRMIETIETGEPKTPFLKFGDRVKITMINPKSGQPIFGAIDCEVVKK